MTQYCHLKSLKDDWGCDRWGACDSMKQLNVAMQSS